MKNNFFFIIISFFIISIVIIFFSPKNKNNKNNNNSKKLIKKKETSEYQADILIDTREQDNNIKEFDISNVLITNENLESKEYYNFDEYILVNFDYKLPDNIKYTFRLSIEISDESKVEGELETDIVRVNTGNTKKNPMKFKLLEKDDIYITKINILIYSLDDLEIPKHVHSLPVNIVFESKKNAINEEINRLNINLNNIEFNNTNSLEDLNELDCKELIKRIGKIDIENISNIKEVLNQLEQCAKNGSKLGQRYIDLYYSYLDSIN
jgi:hypothetical protein